MSVTVSAKKTVGFRSPYISDTFQELTSKIIGRDGYISGGSISDAGSVIRVGPIVFTQNGIIAETEVTSSNITVPTGPEPWFVIAAVPDDDPLTGVVLSITKDLTSASNGVVIAFKSSGSWQNPPSVDIRGASQNYSEAGVESGAQPRFTLDGSDNMDEFILNRGRIVDPDGVRRDLPKVSPSSAKNFGVTPVRAHASKSRTDHIVLRQRESHSPETKHLIGPLVDDGTYASITKTGTRQGYYAKRGGSNDEQWFAYGDGSDLRVMGGPAGGGFSDAVLLVAATTVGEVWIAGQRSSDDAIILLYTDGILLRMASFNAVTGVIVDSPVTIDIDGNACNHVRAEIDTAEQIHIVYERNDGGSPTQQIYYTRRSIAASSFADAAITHRIIHGSNTGKNDVYPDIDVDRHGNAHIVYTTGVSTNLYGDLVYAVFDSSGNLTTDRTYLTGSSVGVQASATDDIGFISTIYGSFHKARITVTDFDEVFCALTAGLVAGTTDSVLLFSPGFNDRIGFPIVNVGGDSLDLLQYGPYSIDIVSNELGEIRIAYAISVIAVNLLIVEIGINSVFAENGLLTNSITRESFIYDIFVSYIAGTDEDDLILRRGTVGDIRLSHRINTGNVSKQYEIGTLDYGSDSITADRHKKDLYLASYDVAADASGNIPEETLRVHNVRQKKMNYPFLVGIDGDFQGFNSVYEAVRKANVNGGEIVVRKGDYRSTSTVALASGVTLRGEGQVVFDGLSFSIGNSLSSYPVYNIDANIVERIDSFGAALKAGDVVDMATSGFHRILAVLPPKGIYRGRLLLDASSPGDVAPSGVTLIPYPSGNKIENIAILGTFATPRINVYKSYQAVISGISMFGVYTGGANSCIRVDGAHHPLIDNIDFTKLAGAGSPDVAIALENNFRPIVRAIRSTAGAVDTIDIRVSNDTPSASDCSGVLLEDLAAGVRTTPLMASNIFDGDTTGLAPDTDIWTGVGSLIKAPPNESLAFQDENTVAASGPITLTGVDAAFDGATPQSMVDSVNERLKAAGDTLAGDFPTDGTTRVIGNLAGVAGDRVNVGANLLNALGFATLQNAISVGATLLGSVADAEVARVTSPASVFAGVEYTLLWESVPAGSGGFRLYASATGGVSLAVNAIWNNSSNTWSKDRNLDKATLLKLVAGEFSIFYKKTVTATWDDSLWTSSLVENAIRLSSDEAVGVTSKSRAWWNDEDGNRMFNLDRLGFPVNTISRFVEHWYEIAAGAIVGINELPKWDFGVGGAADLKGGTLSTAYRSPHIVLYTTGVISDNMFIQAKTPSVMFTANSVIVASFQVSCQANNISAKFGLIAATNDRAWLNVKSATPDNEVLFYSETVNGANTSTRLATTESAFTGGFNNWRIELHGSNTPGGARVVFLANGVIQNIHTTNLPDVNSLLKPYVDIFQVGTHGSAEEVELGKVEVVSNSEVDMLGIPSS